MMKTLLYTGIILLILSSCTSKTADKSDSDRNDSIKKYLDLAGNVDLDFEKRKLYNDIAYSFLDFRKNDSLTRRNLYTVGINNANLTRFKQLGKNSNELSDLACKSNNKSSKADAYKLQGLYSICISKNEVAIEYFYKAKKILLSLNSSERLTALNKDIAQVQYFSNDFLGSNRTLFENLKCINELRERINKDSNKGLNIIIYRNYSAIANNFYSLKDYKNAIFFDNKALHYTDNKLRYINASYSGILSSYIGLKDYHKADYYMNKIMENPKTKSINPQGYYQQKAMLLYLNLIQNRMKGLPQAFFEIDNYFSNNDDLGGQDYNLVNLSKYYVKVKDTSNAINAAQKALLISKSYKNPSDILSSLKQLIEVDKKNASKNAEEYIRINDSMQLAERRFRNKFAQIEYETEEVTKEKETAIKQKWIILEVLSIVIIIIVLLLVITKQRSKKKELQLLQSQQKANEEIYDLMLLQKSKEEEARQSEKKRIALELHDGVMNKLASTRLNLDVLRHKKDDETINECLRYVDDLYKIEQEIRNISHDLTDATFINSNSFTALINEFVMTQNKTSKCHYKLEMDYSIKWETIASNIKMNLFRIIQESSHNINKFARAKNVIISFVVDNKNLCLSITDDGIGFDTEKQCEGIGLKNIKQRVELLNGKFIIQSSKGKNTSLNIAIPI